MSGAYHNGQPETGQPQTGAHDRAARHRRFAAAPDNVRRAGAVALTAVALLPTLLLGSCGSTRSVASNSSDDDQLCGT